MRHGRYVCLAICALGLGGCAARGNVELLESRLRHQEDALFAIESQLESAESELAVARREADALRTQLAERGDPTLLPEQAQLLYRVAGVRVNKLFTGGLDRDDEPGDDQLNVLLVPHDDQGDGVKLPGTVELEVLDLTQPKDARRVGIWKFSAEEVAEAWHSGLSAGFQFRLPWQKLPRTEELVLTAKFGTVDGRQFDTNTSVRITLPETRLAERSEVDRSSPATFSPDVPFVPPPETPEQSQEPEVLETPAFPLVVPRPDQRPSNEAKDNNDEAESAPPFPAEPAPMQRQEPEAPRIVPAQFPAEAGEQAAEIEQQSAWRPLPEVVPASTPTAPDQQPSPSEAPPLFMEDTPPERYQRKR